MIKPIPVFRISYLRLQRTPRMHLDKIKMADKDEGCNFKYQIKLDISSKENL